MTTKKDQDEAAFFARSAQSDVFGKLDMELPPVRINGDVLAEVQRLASAAGMNVSEYLRTLVHVKVYGIDHVLSLQAARLRRAMGNVEQKPSICNDESNVS
jgi:hypothetical protein